MSIPGATAATRTLRRQFRFPLTLGTDICNIPRIRKIIKGPRRDRFINRVLIPEERGRIYSYLNLAPDERSTAVQDHYDNDQRSQATDLGWRKAAEFMAGRFAAKEAVIKAHPHLRISFEDITIASGRPGQGAAALIDSSSGSRPPVALIRCVENGQEVEQEALVSISHDTDYSTAVCIGMTCGMERE